LSAVPYTPSCVLPTNGATDLGLTPTLQSSAFNDPDPGDTHQATEWFVGTDEFFEEVVWYASDTDTDKTSEQIPVGTLLNDTDTSGPFVTKTTMATGAPGRAFRLPNGSER